MNDETYNERDCHFRDAGLCHVCFQAYHGICTQYPPDRRIYDCLYRRLQEKGIIPYLHLCPPHRFFKRLRDMVDSLSVPVDYPVGRCHAAPCEHPKKNTASDIYACLRSTWFPVRNTLCTCTGSPVRLELSENDCVDYLRTYLRLYPWCQQFLLRNPDPANHFHTETCRAQYGEGVNSRLPLMFFHPRN